MAELLPKDILVDLEQGDRSELFLGVAEHDLGTPTGTPAANFQQAMQQANQLGAQQANQLGAQQANQLGASLMNGYGSSFAASNLMQQMRVHGLDDNRFR